MPIKKQEKRIIGTLLTLFIIFSTLVLLSGGFYGGGDSIAHYRISRYALRYPHLFLDHWGKPVFTILSSPFSWLGFNGTRIFNVIAGLLTAFLTYRTVREETGKDAWLAVFFVILAPVYFILFFSAVTEITFSLVLIFSVYYIYREKYTAAALMISFLPFARTEGFVIVFVILAALTGYRQYKSIPFLFGGFVLFSLAGWPYYHDPLWVIHEIPYTGAADIYGHGTLMHFVHNAPRIFGIPLLFFWILGVYSLVRDMSSREKRERALKETWFVVLPFLAYFAAHSYVWWKGLGSSLGLTRVMAGVVPLVAVTAMRGYRFVAGQITESLNRNVFLPAITLVALLIPPLHFYRVPVQQDETQKVLSQAAEWLKHSPYAGHRIYYYDLYFQFRLGLDPYDTERCCEKVPDPGDPAKDVPAGSIIQWDAHYGPNEGRLPLKKLLDNPEYTLLKVFKPKHSFMALGSHEYAVYIFLRKPAGHGESQ